MRFMNEYDIETALYRFHGPATPNRAKIAGVIDRLADWTNSHSDGWHSWPKPARAAAKAMALVDPVTGADVEHFTRVDATDAEVRAAITPIKAFLTRQNVPQADRDVILAPVKQS